MDSELVKATNKKAFRDYAIEERYQAGIVLMGSEIKSIREGRVNLRDSYALVENGELFVYGMHISPYKQASQFGHEPTRTRKLLLTRDEIKRLTGKITEKGYTLVPLKLYIKNGWAKVELGLAKGKRQYDKRQDMAKKEAQREMARVSKRKFGNGPGE
ncbi:MAG: SsrA-binding protein SmpB [Actinobacteria bacterium]|nr:SsrA-binding protein SmpB [Actinomycetota bacterium]